MDQQQFIQLIKQYYQEHRRSFLWREMPTHYNVFVSEVMLQQTQTFRVEPKFINFIVELPDFGALANAPFAQVLSLWKGLGYNSRALRLQQAAKIIVEQYDGQLPNDPMILRQLPGIGPATSCSIAAFAHQIPTGFIETNIRTVYIHHFFTDRLARNETVADKEIMPLVESTVDPTNPREWYYALMDYGVMLKKNGHNLNSASRHYIKQSKFEGSNRQIRGNILQLLLDNGRLTFEDIEIILNKKHSQISTALEQLITEGLLRINDSYYFLAK